MGAPDEHAPLAPSHADTWAVCAGSRQLIAKLPPPPDGGETEHSRRGTAAHEGFALCLTRDGYTPAFLKGQTMPNGVTLNAEDVAAIKVAVGYVQRRQEESRKKKLPVKMFVEDKLDIGRYLGGRKDIWGTADVQFFAGNTLEVIDYKHGYTHVGAEENRQLILYAIGAMAKAYDPGSQRIALNKVRLTVIQPRGKDKTNPIRTWEVEPDDLFIWAENLRTAAEATEQPDAPLVPGEKQCRWCPAALANACPAREAQVRESMEKAMQIPGAPVEKEMKEAMTTTPPWDAPLVEDESPVIHTVGPAADAPFRWETLGDMAARDVALLPLETRVAIFEQADTIKAFLKETSESLLADAKQGALIPGYKLVKAYGNIAYAVPEEEVAKKVGNLKNAEKGKLLPLDEYMPRKLLSPRQMLNMLKSLVSEKVYQRIEGLTHRPESGPKLVPASAKGTPWLPPADQLFEKQEQEAEQPKELPSFL